MDYERKPAPRMRVLGLVLLLLGILLGIVGVVLLSVAPQGMDGLPHYALFLVLIVVGGALTVLGLTVALIGHLTDRKPTTANELPRVGVDHDAMSVR